MLAVPNQQKWSVYHPLTLCWLPLPHTLPAVWQELELKVRQFRLLLQPVRPLAQAPNVNALWAQLMVEELCRLGINTFAVAPGEELATANAHNWTNAIAGTSKVLNPDVCVCTLLSISAKAQPPLCSGS